jgi:hypothetical protein
MGQSERSLTSFGKRVADLQDRAPEARLDRDGGRSRLLAAPLPQASRRGRVLAIPLAAALAAVFALAVVFWARPREPLRFAVGPVTMGSQAAPNPGPASPGHADRGSVGAWIAAPQEAAQPIAFSDGSRLVLAPAGRARVTAVDADGAEISLERGALDVAVVHRPHARWTVRGGPFLVRVIGTRFDLRWDPATEQLDLALREGAVTVSGPVVGDARAVRAGERLTISAPRGRLEVGAIDTAATADPAPSVPPPAPEAPAATAAPAREPAPSEPPPPIAPTPSASAPHTAGSAVASAAPASEEAPSWRALAQKARYKDALAAAEAEGFDALCAGASARDLRVLGDVARLGGSPPRADQALSALRSRFPGSPEAAAAAFIFGRTAQDRQRDYAAAASWFSRYLAEQPGGEFAAEAAGRLVEAKEKMGDAAGARKAAERYLAAYPDGSHAAYARSVLARSATPAP